MTYATAVLDEKKGLLKWIFHDSPDFSCISDMPAFRDFESRMFVFSGGVSPVEINGSYRLCLQLPDGLKGAIPTGIGAGKGRFNCRGGPLPSVAVFSEELHLWEKQKDVDIYFIFSGKDKAYAENAISVAGACVEFYQDFFGLYPHHSLTVLEGSVSMTGGKPMAPGIVQIHRGKPSAEISPGFNEFILAHEIAHQYFYPDENGPGDYWLLMALGMWAGFLCTEALEIKAGAYDYMKSEFFRYKNEGHDFSFRRDPVKAGNRYNMAVIHGGGLLLMEKLAESAGFDRFNDFFRKVPLIFSEKPVTAESFENEMKSRLEVVFDEGVWR